MLREEGANIPELEPWFSTSRILISEGEANGALVKTLFLPTKHSIEILQALSSRAFYFS